MPSTSSASRRVRTCPCELTVLITAVTIAMAGASSPRLQEKALARPILGTPRKRKDSHEG